MNEHNMNLSDLSINTNWTLFLDRDGVINKRIPGDYVKKWDEFEFLEGVSEAISSFSSLFGKIVVVTNQQGIGKGIMHVDDLMLIHSNMCYELNYFGGRIDKVYFSPYLESENHPTRKPGIGMALNAQKDFPQINFSMSMMVGDSVSDLEFGKKAGMKTVFINNKSHALADFTFASLSELANELKRIK